MDATSSTATRPVLRMLAVSSAVAIAAMGLLVLPSPVAARAASAPDAAAWLRLAHLSPGTGPVDVWLTPFGGVPGAANLRHVTYGAFSSYRSLAPGFYTIAMRAAGASSATPALLAGQVNVAAGHAYSVLAEDKGTTLALRVVPDDLAAPAARQGRVRLIQASTAGDALDVSAVEGPVLVQSAEYGTVSPYADVPQGRWTLRIASTSNAVPPTSATVDVAAGTVVTLLVVNGHPGTVALKPILDAAAPGSMPVGSVNTGGGGLAELPPAPVSFGSTPMAALVAALLAGSVVVGWRGRRRVGATDRS